MPKFPDLSGLSLRAKLILSYLAVALGAIFIVASAIAFSVQSYFNHTQFEALRSVAVYRAKYFEDGYLRRGSNWGPDSPFIAIISNDPVLTAIVDEKGNLVACGQPASIVKGNCDDPILKSALEGALKGQEQSGYLPVTTRSGTTFSSLYVSIPLKLGNQIIGSMFLSSPQIYPDPFPSQVNNSILVTVVVVSLLVVLFSLLLARSLTRPMKSLTEAAEQMKHGKYTQRVVPPKAQDELGLLAQTFNEMADMIEADVNELRCQEQARRELLANIVHDLATPLTAIQGLSEALADNVISDPVERYTTTQSIKREVQRLRRMVAELQQMSSLESGQVRLDLAPLNLYELVEETLAVIMSECTQRGISVQNDSDPFMPLVLADSDRITQILLNLLDNARRHTPSEGKITLSASPGGEQWGITVSDTGEGISADDLPHIFERFYRADRSRSGSTGGSGLGLSIVKAIVTAHGGYVWAESVPGKGTSISFTLPLAPVAGAVE
jgi:signal transduction histidine kinase